MTDHMLTVTDRADLRQCEKVIEHGLRQFLLVGTALMQIKENKLYREQFSTFEEYVKERWQRSASWAYRTIEAAQCKNRVSLLPIGDKLNTERQLREWAKIPEEHEKEVAEAIASNLIEDEPITASLIKKTAAEYFAEPENVAHGRQNEVAEKPDWRDLRSVILQHVRSAYRELPELNKQRPHANYDEAVTLLHRAVEILGAW